MSVDEYVNEQINRGTCEVINVHGTMHRNNGRTIVCGGSVVINKGGKKVVLKGDRIIKENGAKHFGQTGPPQAGCCTAPARRSTAVYSPCANIRLSMKAL